MSWRLQVCVCSVTMVARQRCFQNVLYGMYISALLTRQLNEEKSIRRFEIHTLRMCARKNRMGEAARTTFALCQFIFPTIHYAHWQQFQIALNCFRYTDSNRIVHVARAHGGWAMAESCCWIILSAWRGHAVDSMCIKCEYNLRFALQTQSLHRLTICRHIVSLPRRFFSFFFSSCMLSLYIRSWKINGHFNAKEGTQQGSTHFT